MVFSRVKPRRELVTDLAMVALLQLVALGYGVWTLHAARPVHLVFEYQRLNIVHAADIDAQSLLQAPSALQTLPLTGPTLLSLRPFKDANEQYESTVAAVAGVPQAAQPMLWQSWEAGRADILQAARPMADLQQRFSTQSPLIASVIASTGRPAAALRYLPLVTRKESWTVLIDAETTLPVAFVPLDSF